MYIVRKIILVLYKLLYHKVCGISIKAHLNNDDKSLRVKGYVQVVALKVPY